MDVEVEAVAVVPAQVADQEQVQLEAVEEEEEGEVAAEVVVVAGDDVYHVVDTIQLLMFAMDRKCLLRPIYSLPMVILEPVTSNTTLLPKNTKYQTKCSNTKLNRALQLKVD